MQSVYEDYPAQEYNLKTGTSVKGDQFRTCAAHDVTQYPH